MPRNAERPDAFGINKKFDGARELLVSANLAQYPLRKRFDAASRRVQNLGAEISQAMLDDIYKKLVARGPFNRLAEFTAARLMDESREFLGSIAEFVFSSPHRIELEQGHQACGVFVQG